MLGLGPISSAAISALWRDTAAVIVAAVTRGSFGLITYVKRVGSKRKKKKKTLREELILLMQEVSREPEVLREIVEVAAPYVELVNEEVFVKPIREIDEQAFRRDMEIIRRVLTAFYMAEDDDEDMLLLGAI